MASIRLLALLFTLALCGCATTQTRPERAPFSAEAPAPTPGFMPLAQPYPAITQYTDLPSPQGESERGLLARLEREFEVLGALIAEAEAVADPGARPRFRYDTLRRDLEMVRHGIRMHLQDPGVAPRRFEPLRGDYRQ